MSTFDKPDAPGRDADAPNFDYQTHLGDLLVIQVTGTQEGVETEYGARNVIVADVHVVSPDATISETFEGAWLFGTVLYDQLKAKKGRTVLGVLEQGEKRPGKKPPWRLADPTDAQEDAAIKAMTARPDKAEEQPQPATVSAGRAPWE